MGFDKPDLGFVVHLGAPQSPIAYYQQIGRAGRGVERADVILLPGREDADIWAYFASLAFPPERVVRTTLAALAEASRPVSTSALETRVDLSRSRLEMMLKVLDVDGAVRRVSGGWEATGQDWAYDADRYARVSAERAREQRAMLGYITTETCRMEYLRRELDDPAAAPCGRCDNCTGQPWSDAVSEEGTAAARDRLLRPGVQITPRKMWPTGMKELGVDVSGKIPASLSAEPGRALGRLTDLGWGPRLHSLLADGVPDEQVPGEFVAAMVKVLAGWDWAQRPAGVITLPSRTRPRLVRSLGERIAEIGRLPCLGGIAYAAGAAEAGSAGAAEDSTAGAGQHDGARQPEGTPQADGARQYNSAHRLLALWQSLAIPEQLGSAVARLSGPVLLVDDRIETGWTMTVAARLLREAGAPAVLPLVLAASS
jgi:ATP-dependent DNA helicase RecQ